MAHWKECLRAALIGLAVVTPAVEALPAQSRESLLWTGYFASAALDAQWSLALEYQERFWGAPLQRHQRVRRVHLHRQVGSVTVLTTGFTYFEQGSQDPRVHTEVLVPELRPHVQAEVRQRWSERVSVAQRGRAEFRAFRRVEDGTLTDGFRTAGRLRYRVGLDVALWPALARGPSLKVSDEIMVMLGDRNLADAFDQNRIEAGFSTPLSEQLALDVTYLWWHQRRPGQADVIDRDIFRLALRHRWR